MDIEQIVSQEAVSESGPGADLHTYVEPQEARTTTPKQSIDMSIGFQHTPPKIPPFPQGNTGPVESQNGQTKDAPVDRSGLVSDESRKTHQTSGNHKPSQLSLQMGFDPLIASNCRSPKLGETMQGYTVRDKMQILVYGAPTNPEAIPSEDGFSRSTVEGFESTKDVISMDSSTGDDDFWWARPLGSVSIL